jgi:hypothetical protein
MRFRQGHGLLAGIAVLFAGAAVLGIALVRLHTAVFGQPLGLAAAALPLLGAVLGGLLLVVVPSLSRRQAVLARLGSLAALAAAGTLAALLILVHTKALEPLDASALGRVAVLYLVSSLPFAAIGLAFAATLRSRAASEGRLGSAAFAGAAAGVLLAIPAMRAGGLRAALAVPIADGLAAILFYAAARRPPEDGEARVGRPPGGVVATVALASAVLFAGDVGAPWLKLPMLRWAAIERADHQEWSVLGLVTVDKLAGGAAVMRTDGIAATSIYDPKTTLPTLPDELPYLLHKDRGPVLVVGAGGGRDLRIALKHGQKEIHAIEADPIVAGPMMRDRYHKLSGELYDKPEVHVVVGGARSFLRGSPLVFRSIVVAHADSATAAGAGALALVPSELFTEEAFAELLGHLVPEGTLLVTVQESALDRLLALAAASLRRVGAGGHDGAHLFGCGSGKTVSLLVKRTPLEAMELLQLRNSCRRSKFIEAFASDQPHRRRIAGAEASPPVDPGRPRTLILPVEPAPRPADADAVELGVPTDERPFFFATVPARLLGPALRDLKGLRTTQQGLLGLVGLLAVGVALAVLCLLAPLAARGEARMDDRAPSGPRGRPLLFFTGLGAGFVLAGVGIGQRLVVLLGHPARAFSIVAPALLFWAALGSLRAGRAGDAEGSAGRRAQLLVAVLAACAAALAPLVDRAGALPLGARAALGIALLAPVGLPLGALGALGIALTGARSPALVPWCCAVAATAGLVAIPVGVLLAVYLGWSALVLAGGACLLVVAAAVPRSEPLAG